MWKGVEKMMIAMMIIGVWGCKENLKSGSPKTPPVQKMHHSVAHFLRLNWHLSNRSTLTI
jgi:hypothetical protein